MIGIMLDCAILERLRHLARPRTYRSGAMIFRQGGTPTALYRVLEGVVRLERTLADGSSVVVGRAAAGETFAEAALFSPTYRCDAVAEADSVVETYARTEVLSALQGDAKLAMGLAESYATQVRDLRQLLEIRAIKSAQSRLFAWLHWQAEQEPPLNTLTLDRSWLAVAREIDLTPEAVYRARAKLHRRGFVTAGSGRTVHLSSFDLADSSATEWSVSCASTSLGRAQLPSI